MIATFVLTLFMCSDPNAGQCPIEREPVATVPFNSFTTCEKYGKASMRQNKFLAGFTCTRHE